MKFRFSPLLFCVRMIVSNTFAGTPLNLILLDQNLSCPKAYSLVGTFCLHAASSGFRKFYLIQCSFGNPAWDRRCSWKSFLCNIENLF